MDLEFTNIDELEKWLEDKPRHFSKELAFRSALRTLPKVLDPNNWTSGRDNLASNLIVFRALILCWSQLSWPNFLNIKRPSIEVTQDYYDSHRNKYSRNDEALLSQGSIVDLVNREADDIDVINAAAYDKKSAWKLISEDCMVLGSGVGARRPDILTAPLLNGRPSNSTSTWEAAENWFQGPGAGFQIWREWHIGRLRGADFSFAGFDDAADNDFCVWIARQEAGWWRRDPSDVNLEISEYVEDLRPRKVSATVPQTSPEELLRQAEADLRTVLGAALNQKTGLPFLMQSVLRNYNDHFLEYGINSAWAGLDRYISVVQEGLQELDSLNMRAKRAMLEQLIRAHQHMRNLLPKSLEEEDPTLKGSNRPTVLEPDNQLPVASTFSQSANNKIGRDEVLGRGELRTNEAGRSQHASALRRAKAAAEHMRGSNGAPGFEPIATRVADALSEKVETVTAGDLILEVESLRAEFEEQQNPGPGDEWEPLGRSDKRVIEDAISALNLYIGSEPFLEEMEARRLGPDYEPELAPPPAIEDLADTLEKDDLSEQDTDHTLRQAADNAPDESNPTDRRTTFLSEVSLNVVRWTIEFIVRYEDELLATATTGTGVGMLIDPVTTSSGLGLAWALAKSIKHSEEKWRKIASQARVTEQNFERVMALIKKLPLV